MHAVFQRVFQRLWWEGLRVGPTVDLLSTKGRVGSTVDLLSMMGGAKGRAYC